MSVFVCMHCIARPAAVCICEAAELDLDDLSPLAASSKPVHEHDMHTMCLQQGHALVCASVGFRMLSIMMLAGGIHALV